MAMAKKRIKGVNIETSTLVGSFPRGFRDKGAATQEWWRSVASQGIEFGYMRFFDGLTPPTYNEEMFLLRIGLFDRMGIALGSYCVLNPLVDGEHQARLFIDYMAALQFIGLFRPKVSFSGLYRVRPALWLVPSNGSDPSSVRENARLWLDTVTRFMCEPVAGGEPLYQDKPILATTYEYAELIGLSKDPNLNKYHLWIFDESQGTYPAANQYPEIPKGMRADLWQTKSRLPMGGQEIGFNYSVDLGRKEPEPKKSFPIRRASAVPLMIFASLAFGPWVYRKITKAENAPSSRGLYDINRMY